MPHCKSSLCLVVSVLVFGWAASGNAQVTQSVSYFELTDVDFAQGPIYMNDSGTIAGSYYQGADVNLGFVMPSNGKLTIFDVGGEEATEVMGIDAEGTVTGQYNLEDPDDTPTAGFLRSLSGEDTTFGIPGADYVAPSAMSPAGDVAGSYMLVSDYRSFIRSASGVIKTYDAPGEPTNTGNYRGPVAVNDSGTVIGDYWDTNTFTYHGYIRSADGEISTPNLPGYTVTYFAGLNNKGQITGWATLGDSSVGFILDSAGKFTILPTIYPDSINQGGDVCGVDVAYNTVIRYRDGRVSTLAVDDNGLTQNFGCTGINTSRTVVGCQNYCQYDFISNPLTAIDYSTGFSEASDLLNLKGSAALSGSQLMLTNGKDSEASSAYYGYPVDIRSFSTDFTFVPSHAVADGLTFTIQNADPSAVGFPGAGLGYQNIGQSVAIKFDFHNNFGEGSDSTGLYLNGVSPTIPAIDLSHTGINLVGGDPIKVHVTYDSASSGGALVLTITDETTMDTWSKSFAVDIPGAVGATTAYVGFTASTGGKTSTLALTSWAYQAGSTTP